MLDGDIYVLLRIDEEPCRLIDIKVTAGRDRCARFFTVYVTYVAVVVANGQ